MEQSKLFYENSTRQLVNILECLSSQLSVSKTCNTRHCDNNTDNNDIMDTDSFDSLLSRRSHDQSSHRPSIDSYKHQPEPSTGGEINYDQSPVYENVFYDNFDPTNAVISPQKVANVAQTKCLKLSEEHIGTDSSKNYRRCDSYNSVLVNNVRQFKALPLVPVDNTSRPNLSKEGGTRNRFVNIQNLECLVS